MLVLREEQSFKMTSKAVNVFLSLEVIGQSSKLSGHHSKNPMAKCMDGALDDIGISACITCK